MWTATLDEMISLHTGEPLLSDWVLIDQTRIDRFADATEDYQFIHVSAERAAQTPFGGTIAHGLLLLSILPALLYKTLPTLDGAKMSVNYGYNRVRFIAPVRSGKRVRAGFTTVSFTEAKPGQWQHVLEVTLEIEGESKPALVAEWIGMNFI